MRVVEMLDRELLVVSEDIPHDNPYKEYMVSATADDLAVCIKDILQSESWTHLGCLNAAKYREKMDVKHICQPVIDETIKALR